MSRWLKKWGFPFATREMLSFGGDMNFKLRVQIQTTETIALQVTGMTKDGAFNFRISETGDGTVSEHDFPIPDVPVFASVRDRQENEKQGAIFVRILLLGNDTELTELAAGNVYNMRSVTWPFSNVQDQIPGHGEFKVVASSNPSAGSEASIFVPQHRLWRLYSARVQLTTDSNAANRRVQLVLHEGSSADIYTFSSQDQTASTTRGYNFAHFGHTPEEIIDGEILVNIPNPIWLTSESFIETETFNIQAGDDFGVMRLKVEEFPYLNT